MAVAKVILNGNTLIDTTDKTVTSGGMLSGVTALKNDGTSITGSIVSQAAQTITPTTTNQTIASGKYLTGTQTILGDANLVAENIADGVTIFGVTGTHQGGGGGSNWTLLGSAEYTVITSSTSITTVGTISLSNDSVTAEDVVWVHIRMKNGAMNNRFYGSDTIFINASMKNGGTSESYKSVTVLKGTTYTVSTGAYGIFANKYDFTNKEMEISSRYHSNYTGTINGIYVCDVYKLTVPSGMVMFA